MNTHRTNKLQAGLSMIELLVALAIGSFLIIGAVTVQSQTRKTFDVNEQQARLQESARYVLSILEPDLQMAGLYGFTQDPNAVMWSDPEKDIADEAKLIPPSRLHEADFVAPGAPGSLDDCGDNFATDVLATVTATNGDFVLDCAAEGGGHVDDTDTLMLRHASTVDTESSKSKLQIFSSPKTPFTQTRISVTDDENGDAPGNVGAGIEGAHSVRDMIIQAYYIATNADGHDGVPAMRRKVLDTDGTDPVFRDQEMIRGIEDLQVQFGVDPGADIDGTPGPDDPGNDGLADFVNGFAAKYVNPEDVGSGQVVAVRVWVRVRADQEEPGFKDERLYQYADTEFQADDRFRRVLMSRTIFLRNSRQQ